MRLKKLAMFVAAAATASPLIGQTVLRVIDGSGTVAAAGVSQTVFSENTNRVFLRCQNPSVGQSGVAAESLFINYDAPASIAAVNSEEIVNGGSVNFSGDYVPKGTVQVTAATAGHRFICKAR